MEAIKIIPSANANEVVLVANTPSFIFKRLREDTVVRYIVDTHSADEIVNWFAFHSGKPENPEDLVLRYMYLVALSMKEAKDVSRLIGKIPVDTFQWGKEICDLAVARARQVNILSITAKPKAAYMSSASSTGIIVPDGKDFQLRWMK